MVRERQPVAKPTVLIFFVCLSSLWQSEMFFRVTAATEVKSSNIRLSCGAGALWQLAHANINRAGQWQRAPLSRLRWVAGMCHIILPHWRILHLVQKPFTFLHCSVFWPLWNVSTGHCFLVLSWLASFFSNWKNASIWSDFWTSHVSWLG